MVTVHMAGCNMHHDALLEIWDSHDQYMYRALPDEDDETRRLHYDHGSY